MLKKIIMRYIAEPTTKGIRYFRHKILNLSEASPQTTHVMGMTSIDEQEFYTKCSAEQSNSIGAIVDIGCWMCSTTISLAKGVRDKQAEKNTGANKVYAFDLFIWEHWMDRYLPRVQGNYKAGDTFLPEARFRIHGYEHVIELEQANLIDYTWQRGPIKILLVDAMKNQKLTESIATSFFPFLTKNSVLIHQDFKHFYTPWIHILQYRLRDYFRLKHEVINGATVAFETIQQIPTEVTALAVQFDNLSDNEVKEAFDYSMTCVHDDHKSAIAAAHIMYFVHSSRAHKARDMLTEYTNTLLLPTNDFIIVKEKVESMSN